MSAELKAREGASGGAGTAKAAALLERLGRESAGEVVRRLSPAEVERVAQAFVRMHQMSSAERGRLAEEAVQEVASGEPVGGDLVQLARELFEEHLGAEGIERMLKAGPRRGRGTASLEWVPDSAAEAVADALKEENPRIVGLVLAAVRPTLAAQVVGMLPGDVRGRALLQVAVEQRPTPEAMLLICEKVAKLVKQWETGGEGSQQRVVDTKTGTGRVAEILRHCDRGTERGLVEYLQEHAAEVARDVSQSLFSRIEDLKWLDGRSIQMVVREVDVRRLARALRGAPEELQKQCFENLSENAAEGLREEMEALGPTPRREVEAARQEVLELVRTMLEEERIQVAQEEEELI